MIKYHKSSRRSSASILSLDLLDKLDPLLRKFGRRSAEFADETLGNTGLAGVCSFEATLFLGGLRAVTIGTSSSVSSPRLRELSVTGDKDVLAFRFFLFCKAGAGLIFLAAGMSSSVSGSEELISCF